MTTTLFTGEKVKYKKCLCGGTIRSVLYEEGGEWCHFCRQCKRHKHGTLKDWKDAKIYQGYMGVN